MRWQPMTFAIGWVMPLGTEAYLCFKSKSESGYCFMDVDLPFTNSQAL